MNKTGKNRKSMYRYIYVNVLEQFFEGLNLIKQTKQNKANYNKEQ